MYVLYDKFGVVVGLCRTSHPPALSTIRRKRAASARHFGECPQADQEDARRVDIDSRSIDGARRRTGGHGFSGGDGFAKV